MPKKNNSFIRGVLLGAALGIGALAYRQHRERAHPLRTPAQRRINAALERTLQAARQQYRLPLSPDTKLILFSDHHKGSRDGADDFMPCETTYLAALDFYQANGFTLVLLGDVEELWENETSAVMPAYPNVFEAEQAFFPQRYIRIVGNHDDAWNDPALVAQYLAPYYPGIRVHQGLVLEYADGEQSSGVSGGLTGEIFLAHGHQGTLDSEVFAGFAPHLLPLYRRLQNLTGIGRTTPAENAFLRGQHDTQMYRWSSQKGKLILIAGHTHRPVWTSLTHLDQLTMQLYALTIYQDKLSPAEYAAQRQRLLDEIARRERTDPPHNDTLKTRPAYFNTGCCRFKDGDITGIEITGQDMRLVKWSKRTLERQDLAGIPLKELFARL